MSLKHTEAEYAKCLEWLTKGGGNNAAIKAYYEEMARDLRNLLIVFRGIRLRDIRYFFQQHCGQDLDLERLEMESWSTFLVACRGDVNLFLDIAKEEVVALKSDKPATESKNMFDLERMIHSTPKNDDLSRNLVPILAKDAFLKGYMDVADGQPMADPRIPNQDLGVAAAAAKKEGEREKKRNQRTTRTWEEQIAKPVDKAVVTIETTGPLEATQTGDVNDFFAGLQALQMQTEDTEDSILAPSQIQAAYGPIHEACSVEKYGTVAPPFQPSRQPSRKELDLVVNRAPPANRSRNAEVLPLKVTRGIGNDENRSNKKKEELLKPTTTAKSNVPMKNVTKPKSLDDDDSWNAKAPQKPVLGSQLPKPPILAKSKVPQKDVTKALDDDDDDDDWMPKRPSSSSAQEKPSTGHRYDFLDDVW